MSRVIVPEVHLSHFREGSTGLTALRCPVLYPMCVCFSGTIPNGFPAVVLDQGDGSRCPDCAVGVACLLKRLAVCAGVDREEELTFAPDTGTCFAVHLCEGVICAGRVTRAGCSDASVKPLPRGGWSSERSSLAGRV